MDGMAKKKKPAPKDEEIRIRVTPEEKEAFAEAAKKADRNLSDWLRHLAKQAAAQLGVTIR